MLVKQFLCGIGVIEILFGVGFVWFGMVVFDDYMCQVVIVVDDVVLYCFVWVGYVYGKVYQGQMCCGLWVFVQYGFIVVDVSEMIDIVWFCYVDDGVDQQIGLCFVCGMEGQFLMCVVQWIVGLKCYDVLLVQFVELCV